MPRRALPALAALVALTVSLLTAEAIARLAASLEPSARVAIYRASSAPGVRYTLIPDLDTRALGADLRTNALGFRGPAWRTEKVPGTIRVALIGDSHAFGFGVDYADTIGEVLARDLSADLGRPVEVLNFAVIGYDTAQELAVLQSFALAFAPDVVVIVPCNNDDEPALFASRAGYLVARAENVDLPPPRATPRSGSALLALAGRALDRMQRELTRSAGVHTVPPVDVGPLLDRVPVSPALRANVERPLRTMIRLSRARGASVVLAPLAGPPEWRHMFRDVARADDVPMVELLQLLPEGRDWDEMLDRFGLGWDPHLGPVAHARWGKALAATVRTQLALPPA